MTQRLWCYPHLFHHPRQWHSLQGPLDQFPNLSINRARILQVLQMSASRFRIGQYLCTRFAHVSASLLWRFLVNWTRQDFHHPKFTFFFFFFFRTPSLTVLQSALHRQLLRRIQLPGLQIDTWNCMLETSNFWRPKKLSTMYNNNKNDRMAQCCFCSFFWGTTKNHKMTQSNGGFGLETFCHGRHLHASRPGKSKLQWAVWDK